MPETGLEPAQLSLPDPKSCCCAFLEVCYFLTMTARTHAITENPSASHTNTTDHDYSIPSSKNVRKMSDKKIVRAVIGKADSRYWQQAGKMFIDRRSRFYACKIQVAGRRESFPLRTANKSAAASKAAQVYGDVIALGWDATMAKHKPSEVRPTQCATVGELLSEVRATAGLRLSTFTVYAQSLRQIVSEIAKIGDQPALDENKKPRKDKKGRIIYLSRRSHIGGGREAWAAKVDAQPLDGLTVDAVQRWKLNYIAKAGGLPDAERRATTSAATLIRNARSLFSEKTLQFARARITLPEPLPFAGVKLGQRQNSRYISKLDAEAIIAEARAELTGASFQIFILALLVGLRKREVDTLLWQQIDFDQGQLRIEATRYFQPKSEDSIATVDLDPETLQLLRDWKAQNKGEFVIASTHPARYGKTRSYYRCQSQFNAVYEWLRSKGVTARKPLHELRKELGAILASSQGIFAAQTVLRHAHIGTTAAYYADKKGRITAGLGRLLKD